MYQKKLLEHFKNSLYRGVVSNPDFSSGKHIPSCGDSISITGTIKNRIITDIKFEGTGCILSQAAASMLADLVKGKMVSEVQNLTSDDMMNLIGVQLGPNRAQCVFLPLQALQAGLSHA